MVPEALGRVYLICLCLDVYVSVLVLPCLTGLLPPPSRPTTVCLSFLALPLLSGTPSPILSSPPPTPPPRVKQSCWSSRPGGQLLRCQQDVPNCCRARACCSGPDGWSGGPERLQETWGGGLLSRDESFSSRWRGQGPGLVFLSRLREPHLEKMWQQLHSPLHLRGTPLLGRRRARSIWL